MRMRNILTIVLAIIMVLSSAPTAQAALDFDFEDQTRQGWIDTNGTAWLGRHGDAAGPPYSIESANLAGTDRSHDGQHPTFIFSSPEFAFDQADNSDLTFVLFGGESDEAFPTNYTLTQLLIDHPMTEDNSGYAGGALRNVETGVYVWEGHRTVSDDINEVFTIPAAFIDTLDQSAHYQLDFIDWNQGGWGWTDFDTVHIPGTTEFSDGTLNSNVANGVWNALATWIGDPAPVGGLPTKMTIVNILDGHTVSMAFLSPGKAGELTIDAGGTVNATEPLAVSGTIINNGALNISAGKTVSAGTASTTGVNFLAASSTLDVDNLTIDNAVDLGAASITLDNNITIAPSGTLSMGAVAAPYNAPAGNLTIEGVLANASDITVNNLTVAAPLTITTGEILTVTGLLTVAENGVLQVDDGLIVGGAGTVANFKLNGGTLQATAINSTANWNFQDGTIDAGSTLSGNVNIVIGADRSSDGLLKMLGANTHTGVPTIVIQRGAVQDIPTGHRINFASNNDSHAAAVEVTADSRFEIGTGIGQVNWASGRGGFAASGADYSVTLVDALDVPLATNWATWGNQNFQIGSHTATHTVNFTNDIDFIDVNTERTLHAFGTGGTLSGALTNTGRIHKRGDGLLQIGALTTTKRINIYDGELRPVGDLNLSTTGTRDESLFLEAATAKLTVPVGVSVESHFIGVFNGGMVDVSGNIMTRDDWFDIYGGSDVIVRGGGHLQAGAAITKGIAIADAGTTLLVENGGAIEMENLRTWNNGSVRIDGTAATRADRGGWYDAIQIQSGADLTVGATGSMIGAGNEAVWVTEQPGSSATIQAAGYGEAFRFYTRNQATLDIYGTTHARNEFIIESGGDVTVHDGGAVSTGWNAWWTGNYNPAISTLSVESGGTVTIGNGIYVVEQMEATVDAGGVMQANWMNIENGGIAVINGTLTLNEDLNTWNSGTTIGGSGQINAHSVYIRGAHTLAPGSSTGTLSSTVTGEFKLEDGAIYELEIGSTTDHDLINVNGKLNLDSTWILKLLDVGGVGGIDPSDEIDIFTFTNLEDGLQTYTIDTSALDTNVMWDTSGVSLGEGVGRIYITGLTMDLASPTSEYAWNGNDEDWSIDTEWTPAGPLDVTGKANVLSGVAHVVANHTVHTLDIDGGTVSVDVGTLSVTNDLNLIDGSLTVANGATVDEINMLAMTGGTMDVTGRIDAKIVSLAGEVNLNSGAEFNAWSVNIDGGTTTVANGVTINGDFSLNAGGTLAITGNVNLANLVFNSGTFDFGDVGHTLTVGTFRQNNGTSALAAGDHLKADTYQLNGGNVGFAMTDATGASDVKVVGNSTTLNAGFTHTYTGKTIVTAGTLTANAEISATEQLLIEGGTLNLNSDLTTTGSGEVPLIANQLNQSIFFNPPGNLADVVGAAYQHSPVRTMTGDKANTLLTAADSHSGFATGEIDQWNTFPTFDGNADQFATAVSGVFIPSETGSYNFRFDCDDQAQMWIDMDDDGIFDSGENVGPAAWTSNGSKNLTAGTIYSFLSMAREWGGGQSFNWWVTKPSGGEDRVNPADAAGNGGMWAMLNGYGGATRLRSGVLNIGAGAMLNTANVLIDADGVVTVNDGGINSPNIQVSGTLNLAFGDALSDGVSREAPVAVNKGGMVNITSTGGLNRSSQMLIKKYGVLTGDLNNLAYSETPGTGLVTLENRAVLAPLAGAFPIQADIGVGNKVLYGVLNSGDSVQAGASVEAVGGNTIFEGAYFGPGSYAGGDYNGTLTNEAASGDLLVVVNQDITLNGASLASTSGTTHFEVLEGGRVTVTGASFNGNNDIIVTGQYDTFDGSGMNTTGQSIFRVRNNDILQNGQTIRVDKGVFHSTNDWPVTGGATATVTIGPLGGIMPMDWWNNETVSPHIRRGTYIIEAGGVVQINWEDRLRQNEAMWDIDPDAFVFLEGNVNISNVDLRVPGGAQEELDNVNWIIAADQFGDLPMGAGRRMTLGWDQGHNLHDTGTTIVKSASNDPSSGLLNQADQFVIFSNSGGGWNTNGVGGEMDINSKIYLSGVDIMINDGIQSSDKWITLPKRENDLTRRTVLSDGRVNFDGYEIQARDIIVRNGYLRIGSDQDWESGDGYWKEHWDTKPVFTGKIEIWDNGVLELFAAREEGQPNAPATDASRLRYKVENDTLAPGGLHLNQGAELILFYRNFDSSSPTLIPGEDANNDWYQMHASAVPHVINQTINIRGIGDVPGKGRTWSGDAMSVIRFEDRGPDTDGDNHILFPNIVLEDGAHLGVQRANVDREELRLGVTLKGNARMERENEEWGFQNIKVETPGQEFTLTVDRDGNGGQYDMYGTIGAGVTLTGVDVHFDFNWGANLEDGAVVAHLGRETPGEPGDDGYVRVFTGSDGTNPITGGTFLISGDQDMEVVVDDHDTTQIVNNFGATIKFVDNGLGGRAGFVRSRRRGDDGTILDLAITGKVEYADIVIDGAATASIYHDMGTDYNMLRVDTGSGGGALNAEWGDHHFNLNELTGAGRLHNGYFHVDTTLAPGAGAGTLTVQRLITEAGLTYEMEFGPFEADSVLVENELTINDGWTLKLQSDGGFADPTEEYSIFTWNGAAPTVTLDGTDPTILDATTYTINLDDVGAWTGTGVLNYDAAGRRIYLTGISGLSELDWDAVDGSWSKALNWTPETSPAANSDALVAQNGFTATVVTAGQVAFALEIEAGTVDIDGGDLTIATNVDLEGSAFTPNLHVTSGTLSVGGDLNVAAGGNAVVAIAATGIADIANDMNIGSGGVVTVTGGELNVADELTTAGVLTVNSGTINAITLNTSGTTDLAGASGNIDTINVTGGTASIASPIITNVNVMGGTLETASTTITNLSVNGASAAVNTTGAIGVSDLQMIDGVMNLAGGSMTVTNTSLKGGVIDTQSNALVVSDTATLADGTTITKTSGGEFEMIGANVAAPTVIGDRSVMLNGGTTTITPGDAGAFLVEKINTGLNPIPPDVFHSENGGTHTIIGGGRDIWDAQGSDGGDGFTFVYQEFNASEDIDISAHLNPNADMSEVTGGIGGWAKSGLMIRQSLDTSSQNVFECIAHDDNSGLNTQIRRTAGGGTAGSEPAPTETSTSERIVHADNIWVRLTYNASTQIFSTYHSEDGTNWTAHSGVAPTLADFMKMDAGQEMTGTMLVGMAVTSHNINALTQAQFSNLDGFKTSGSGLSLSKTIVNAIEDSTVVIPMEAGLVGTLELGGLTAAPETDLMVETPTTDIQLGSLSLSGGSRIRFSEAGDVELETVTVTVGNGGTLAGGGGYSQLGDWEDDGGLTNLTLGDVTYNWTFGAKDDNYIEVAGDLMFDGQSFTLNVLPGGGSADGLDVALLNIGQESGGPDEITLPFTTINLPAGWTSGAVVHDGDLIVLQNLTTSAVVINIPGDANGDDEVNSLDLAIFKAQFGGQWNGLADEKPDWNGDGLVTLADFVLMRGNWGAANSAPTIDDLTATPEPATIFVMLAAGIPALLKRRRRRNA
jgi:hypothetical protein